MMHTLGDVAFRVTNQVKYTESPIEGILLAALLKNRNFVLCADGVYEGEGMFIIPQKTFGPYRADFYVVAKGYLPHARVWPPRLEKHFIIECDGQEFHSTPDQLEHDRKRDAYCKELGIDVIRLAGSTIYKHADQCAENAARQIRHRLQGGA